MSLARSLWAVPSTRRSRGSPQLQVNYEPSGRALSNAICCSIFINKNNELHYIPAIIPELRRVGGEARVQVDVRLIAATNSDLESKVAAGKFRADLWYRLNIVPIGIPALAERPDDIVPLITHFIQQLSGRYGTKKSVDRSAIDVLSRYHYPGNVRELENILEHSYVLCQSDQINTEDLPQNIVDTVNPIRSLQSTTKNLKQALEAVEREYLYTACQNNKTQAEIASSLGTSQPSVARLLKKHGFRIESS